MSFAFEHSGGVQKMCICGTLGHGLIGRFYDSMIFKSLLNTSMKKKQGKILNLNPFSPLQFTLTLLCFVT